MILYNQTKIFLFAIPFWCFLFATCCSTKKCFSRICRNHKKN